MARFQTVLKRARFVVSPYTNTEMAGFAQVLADSIRTRIQNGNNIYDQPASGLNAGYQKAKSRRGLNATRDWVWTGHTLRCLKVLSASQNRAEIGFLDERLPGRKQTANQIAAFNNKKERQWGVSSKDREIVVSAILTHHRPIVSVKAA